MENGWDARTRRGGGRRGATICEVVGGGAARPAGGRGHTLKAAGPDWPFSAAAGMDGTRTLSAKPPLPILCASSALSGCRGSPPSPPAESKSAWETLSTPRDRALRTMGTCLESRKELCVSQPALLPAREKRRLRTVCSDSGDRSSSPCATEWREETAGPLRDARRARRAADAGMGGGVVGKGPTICSAMPRGKGVGARASFVSLVTGKNPRRDQRGSRRSEPSIIAQQRSHR